MNVYRALSQAPEIASIPVAGDGIEARELLRSGELPLERLVILLDLRMPRMSGLDDPYDREAAVGLRTYWSSAELAPAPAGFGGAP